MKKKKKSGVLFRIQEETPKSMSRKIVLMWVRYTSTDAYYLPNGFGIFDTFL